MKRPRCTSCKMKMKGHKKQRCQKSSTIEYENGNVYTGSTYNGTPSGLGTLKSSNGHVYTGHFLDGKRHGVGLEVGADNYVYNGNWQFDMYHGKGRLQNASGTYDGSFRNGIFHGQGIFVEGVNKYDGQWSSGTRHGQGHQTSVEGSYDGQYRYGFRHGKGTLTTVDGVLYIGHWKRGDKCGHGMSTSAEYTYTGNWYRNMRHGYGHCISAFYGEYTGHWCRDMRHGTGINVYINKTKYEGEWKRGQYNGIGTIQYADGSHYSGGWHNNDYHGEGLLKDGKVLFQGSWQYGNREGLFVEKADSTLTGMYCNDVRHGTFTLENGTKQLYIWGQQLVFPTVRKARLTVRKLLKSDDISAALEVCHFVDNVVNWQFVYKHDMNGILLPFVVDPHKNFQKYAWKLFKQERFLFLEQMIEQLELPKMDSLLLDSISDCFVANPWLVRQHSYSEKTKKKLLKGLHVGECGRCPPKDPFTRELLTEESGSYLSDDKKLAKSVYKKFIEEMDHKPTVREIAHSFDMDDFEEMLKNAQESNDRETIRKLLTERNNFIQNCGV